MFNAYYFYLAANFLYRKKIPFLPKLIKLITFLIYNSSIAYECKIGKGTRFAYGGIGVIIHKDSVIKNNVIIGSGVVVGGKQGVDAVPLIEDNVVISTGSKVLGNIIVGKNSVIGANSVVIKDVPENAIVAGVPAKIIRIKKDNNFDI